MPLTLTYVSESLIEPARCAATLADIAAAARQRNAERGLAAALLFAGGRFAQTIEGTSADVDALMARIACDPRHRVLAVVERRRLDERSMSGWSMAISSDSVFVSQAMTRTMPGRLPAAPADVRRLLKLIRAFTAHPRPTDAAV